MLVGHRTAPRGSSGWRTRTMATCGWLFFFQAEDGIRGLYVTGVQTCALPICRGVRATTRAAPPVHVLPELQWNGLLPADPGLHANPRNSSNHKDNRMSYLDDSIDWQIIHRVDEWLDENVSQEYKDQPLAQDWARISKGIEELGEAVDAQIGVTGQNPRKGVYATPEERLDELADQALTAILAMQHFKKNTSEVRQILLHKQELLYQRIFNIG